MTLHMSLLAFVLSVVLFIVGGILFDHSYTYLKRNDVRVLPVMPMVIGMVVDARFITRHDLAMAAMGMGFIISILSWQVSELIRKRLAKAAA